MSEYKLTPTPEFETLLMEKEGVFEGVSYHIDIYHDKVIEFKTTRAGKAVSEHWMRQIIYYLLATGTRQATLFVQRINHKGRPPFESYTVSVTEEQAGHALEDFLRRRDAFRVALESGRLDVAPIYRGDGEWLCKGCPYIEPCNTIEGRVPTE